MKNLILGIINVIGELSIVDMIVLIALVTFIILIISVIYIYRISDEEIEEVDMDKIEEFDINEVARQIEEKPREVNIKLTPYEEEQEAKAIISYDELIKSNAAMSINYKEEEETSGVSVKQVDLKNIASLDKSSIDTKVRLISYDKEEAFLEALKNLESMLM